MSHENAGGPAAAIIPLSSGASVKHAYAQLRASTEKLIVIQFEAQEDYKFGLDEVEFAEFLASLPASGRLSVAYTNERVGGRDLALLLRCFFIFTGHSAAFRSGFGQPASAAIYAAAARRIGSIAAEKALFGAAPLTSEAAGAAGLAWVVKDAGEAITLAKQRFSTMLCIAKADLITSPFNIASEKELIDSWISPGQDRLR